MPYILKLKIENEDPDNTVEFSVPEEIKEEPKPKRKRGRPRKKKPAANTNTDYGSITEIRKSKNEKALKKQGAFGPTEKG